MVMVTVRQRMSLLSGSRKKWVLFTTLWLSLAMVGCDSASSGPPISRGDVRTEKLKTNLSPDEARELAQPISATPGLSVDTSAAQNAAIGSPGFDAQMNPAMGFVSKRLFDTRAESDRERFERLEAAVQALRDDFDKSSPAINRLMAIEQEIQTLVDQLETLVGGNEAQMADVPAPPVSAERLDDDMPFEPVSMPPPPQDAPATQPGPQETAAEIPAAAANQTPPSAPVTPPAPTQPSTPAMAGPTLNGLRMADHGKTTRIVFETTDKIEYTASVDPENILLVNFSTGSSALVGNQLLPKSDIVKSIDVTPQSNSGFIVAMGLSKMTKIVRQGVLTPDASNPRYRIYIDIER